jgi:hypothetical protein
LACCWCASLHSAHGHHSFYWLLRWWRRRLLLRSSPNLEPTDLPPSKSLNLSSRISILSHIRSATKWGVCKRRTSPSPGDSALSTGASRNATPSQTPLSWLFPTSGVSGSTLGSPLRPATLELKHEQSLRHLRAYATVWSAHVLSSERSLGTEQSNRRSARSSDPRIERSVP